MKFEESSLTSYLVERLTPLTEADAAILAEYVVALLKKDKPVIDLQKLCTDYLVEFLGDRTKSFVTELFQALEDDSVLRPGEKIDATEKREPYQSPDKVQAAELEKLESEDNLSTSSGLHSDSEVSDDDDADRNHKHRRREARSNQFEQAEDQSIRRINRKRNQTYANRQPHLEDDVPHSKLQKEYKPVLGRNNTGKFEKCRSALHAQARAQEYCNNGAHSDLASSIGRGWGRGRNTTWSQHDSRFSPFDALDFASQIASQGLPHPGFFLGTCLPSSSNTQTPPWGSFGFIPGMSNTILDPLHPLGLPGTIGSGITHLNLGIPRQRCKDFEEQGFCLRGDMCPMEHGVNRIVVEDVQSLSQFNLPASLPNSRIPGLHDGTGTLPSDAAPTSGDKATFGKNGKSGRADALPLNGLVSTSGGDADVYDPDQPLWSNDQPGSSDTLLRLAFQNTTEEPFSGSQSFRLSDGVVSAHPTRRLACHNVLLTASSSVWWRNGSGTKSQTENIVDHNADSPVHVEPESNDDHEKRIVSALASFQANSQFGSKHANTHPVQKSHTHARHSNGKAFPKASRTLYVNGIPQKDNKKDALLSHFQKFGDVADLYIPQNSEKAFVQFSTMEEAEAALKAPDAVMGNRFIKLWWAKRDRIFDEEQSSHYKSQPPHSPFASSTQSYPSAAGEGRDNYPSAPTGSSGPASVAALAGPSSNLKENGPMVKTAIQKKTVTLELLKEEIREKEEMLAKKRYELRRQLDKFDKQAGSCKKDEVSIEKAVKRQKIDNTNTAKTSSPGQTSIHEEVQKTLEHDNSKENLASHSSNANPTVMQQFMKDGRQTTRPPMPMVNRFKLDNRPTSFRILPPLPADLLNEAVLKEHFSSFGELSSVVLEDMESCPVASDSQLTHCSSACISFVTRHSAEKAFLAGKYWKSHILKLVWLAPKPTNVPTNHEESPSPKVFKIAKMESELHSNGSTVSPKPTGTIMAASLVKNNSDLELKSSAADAAIVITASIPASKSDSGGPSAEKTNSDDSVVEDVMHLSS